MSLKELTMSPWMERMFKGGPLCGSPRVLAESTTVFNFQHWTWDLWDKLDNCPVPQFP